MIGGIFAALRDLVRTRETVSLVSRLPPLNDSQMHYEAKGGALVHATAIVSDEAELGPDVVIGPFAVVEGRTRIGAGTQVGAHCVIKRYTAMGMRNRIYEHAVIGQEPQDVGFTGEESHLLIGNENVIREGVTIHRAMDRDAATVIGNQNYFMGSVHIAHNCEIGDRVGIANYSGLAGHVRVDSNAYLSGMVGVVERCRIGRMAMVGYKSGVSQDVLPFCTVHGTPARLIGLNSKALRRAGFRSDQTRGLKHAYRLLSARGTVLEESLETLAQLGDPLVDELIAFVKSSRRGFCRAQRRTDRAPGANDARDAAGGRLTGEG